MLQNIKEIIKREFDLIVNNIFIIGQEQIKTETIK